MTDEKEIFFFDRGYDKGKDWYEALFAKASSSARAVGELTADYFSHPEAPQRILETLGPEVKLFVIVREPVERAYAEYRRMRRTADKALSFDEALEAYPAIVRNSLYSQNLEAYRSLFSYVYVHDYELLASDPAAFLQAFFRDLGVDPFHESSRLHERMGESLPSARFQFVDRMTRAGRRVIERAPRGRQLLWALRRVGVVRLIHRVNSQPDISISAAERVHATQYFASDWSRFEGLVTAIRENQAAADR